MREFEVQKMKESETIKGYSDRLIGIANKVILLGITFAYSKIVEIFLVIMPKRYEASITTMEITKNLSNISLTTVIHVLQTQDQKRLMRKKSTVEGALPTKH